MVTEQTFLSYTKCLGGGGGRQQNLPPTTQYGTDSMRCSLTFLLASEMYNSSVWHVHQKHRDCRCPSLGALAGFAPHTSLLGSHQLQSWEFGKIHLPLWEITVIIIEKEILGILSSCWEVPAHSSCKRIHIPPLTSKLQHHPCMLCTFNRPKFSH